MTAADQRARSKALPPAAVQTRAGFRRAIALAAVAYLAIALFAFGPALTAPFDFDDQPAIVDNSALNSLRPSSALLETSGIGTPLDGRPFAAYSFAINEAINRWAGIVPGEGTARETFGFHLVNVLLHVLTGVLLFLLVRVSLVYGRVDDGWSTRANWIAGIVAAVWLIHPIQTEAVDYVTQRTEILASACYVVVILAGAIGLLNADGQGTDRIATTRVVSRVSHRRRDRSRQQRDHRDGATRDGALRSCVHRGLVALDSRYAGTASFLRCAGARDRHLRRILHGRWTR